MAWVIRSPLHAAEHLTLQEFQKSRRAVVALMLVCREFRDVAQDYPYLFSTIHIPNNAEPAALQADLTKAKQTPLFLLYKFCPGWLHSEDVQKQVEREAGIRHILSLQHFFGRIEYEVEQCHDGTRTPYDTDICPPHPEFSDARSYVHLLHLGITGVDAHEAFNPTLVQEYARNLTSLDFSNSRFSNLYPFLHPRLTQLTVSLWPEYSGVDDDSYGGGFRDQPHALMEELAQLLNLSSLSLNMDAACLPHVPPPHPHPNLSCIPAGNLKNLNLHFKFHPTPLPQDQTKNDMLSSLLSMDFPQSLKTLDITISGNSGPLLTFLHSAHTRGPHQALEKFGLDVCCIGPFPRKHHIGDEISVLFRTMPVLKSFNLKYSRKKLCMFCAECFEGLESKWVGPAFISIESDMLDAQDVHDMISRLSNHLPEHPLTLDISRCSVARNIQAAQQHLLTGPLLAGDTEDEIVKMGQAIESNVILQVQKKEDDNDSVYLDFMAEEWLV